MSPSRAHHLFQSWACIRKIRPIRRGRQRLLFSGCSRSKYTKILYALGVELTTMGRFSEAIGELRFASQRASEKAEKAKILSTLGIVYVKADQPVEAMRSLESAVSNGARRKHLLLPGIVLQVFRSQLRCRIVAPMALETDPKHAGARRVLGEVYAPHTQHWVITHTTSQSPTTYQETMQAEKAQHEQLMQRSPERSKSRRKSDGLMKSRRKKIGDPGTRSGGFTARHKC